MLRLTHDGTTGHTGVRKTCLDRVLHLFFWPCSKCDVASFVKSCYTCQLTAKPNHKFPIAPLQPLHAMLEPFEHLLSN